MPTAHESRSHGDGEANGRAAGVDERATALQMRIVAVLHHDVSTA